MAYLFSTFGKTPDLIDLLKSYNFNIVNTLDSAGVVVAEGTITEELEKILNEQQISFQVNKQKRFL